MSLLVCAILLEGGTNHDPSFEDSDFGNTSEKTSDLYLIQSEGHVVDVVLERWKGGRESMLLLVRVSLCAPIP
jgi:hypothetical protein